jgi:glycosyltransferase involved in cell wall biosynthesis
VISPDEYAALPPVTVIVPVFNGESTLPALLAALDAQTYPRDRMQVLVADDASTDGTAQLLAAHAPRVQAVRLERNAGSYAARNAALAQARGAIVAFTDADCRPKPDWLLRGVRALQRQGGGLVAGAVAIEPVARRSAVQRYDQAFGIQQAYFALRKRFGATANLIVDGRVFARVPSFDATLRSGGDKAFCDACSVAGEAFCYAPDCVVEHAPRARIRDLVTKQARIARGHVRIFPLWSRYRILPLSCHPRESLDYAAFCREGDAWFKLRFRTLYYGLECVYLLSYATGCIGLTLKGLFS